MKQPQRMINQHLGPPAQPLIQSSPGKEAASGTHVGDPRVMAFIVCPHQFENLDRNSNGGSS